MKNPDLIGFKCDNLKFSMYNILFLELKHYVKMLKLNQQYLFILVTIIFLNTNIQLIKLGDCFKYALIANDEFNCTAFNFTCQTCSPGFYFNTCE